MIFHFFSFFPAFYDGVGQKGDIGRKHNPAIYRLKPSPSFWQSQKGNKGDNSQIRKGQDRNGTFVQRQYVFI